MIDDKSGIVRLAALAWVKDKAKYKERSSGESSAGIRARPRDPR